MDTHASILKAIGSSAVPLYDRKRGYTLVTFRAHPFVHAQIYQWIRACVCVYVDSKYIAILKYKFKFLNLYYYLYNKFTVIKKFIAGIFYN